MVVNFIVLAGKEVSSHFFLYHFISLAVPLASPISVVVALRKQSLLALRELWFLCLKAFCQRGKAFIGCRAVSAKLATAMTDNATRNQRI